MTVLITLTTAGSDSGPFNLYSDVDGFTSAFEVGVAKIDLLAGYSSSLVPDPTTIIRVMSVNPLCTNYIDLELYPVTTTTTTTLPLEFLLSYECDFGTVIQITADTITGGAPGYYPANTIFYDEPSALANTSWSPFSVESIGYAVNEPNNTFWIAIIDSAGNVAVNSITTNCTDTYTLKKCYTDDPFTVAATYPFSVGNTIQYQIGVPGSGPVYCGIIGGINLIPTPDAEIVSPTVYSCGDVVNCP